MDIGSITWTVEADTSRLDRARDDMDRVGDEARKAGRNTKRLGDEARRAGTKTKQATDKMDRGFKKTNRSASSLTKSVLSLAAAVGAAQFARATVDANVALEAINSSLTVATGSAQAAAREYQFLRDEAQRLGLDLRTSADAFSSLAAAARGTALEGQATRDIFTSVSEAMTALGRDSFATEGALRAIEQMISKGNVSAEELRGQLGERLPGAFQIAARSIGATTQELNKMLQDGELLAEDLLPAMARELSNTFSAQAEAKARGLQAQINRFKTAVFDLMTSGNMQGLANAIGDFTSLISDPGFQQGFSSFISGIIKVAEVGGKAAANLADMANKAGRMAAMSQGFFLTDSVENANEAIEFLNLKLDNLRDKLERPATKWFGGTDEVKAQIREVEQQIAEFTVRRNELLANQTSGDMFGLMNIGIPSYQDTGLTRPTGGGSTGGGEARKFDLGPTLSIPDDTITTVDLIAERYEELQGIAENLSRELRTPQEIYQQEIELLNELRNTRQNNSEQALISQETYIRGVEAAQERLAQSTDTTASEMTVFMEEFAKNTQNILADNLFDFMQGEFEFTADSFKRMLDRMVAEALAADIAGALFGGASGVQGSSGDGLLGSLFSSVAGFFGGGGGGTPSGVMDLAMSALPSLDGGGFTGTGSRSGGLDGQGGFLAMMHPQETVIDHTKGQTGQSINYSPTYNIMSNDTNKIRQTVDQANVRLMQKLEHARRNT